MINVNRQIFELKESIRRAENIIHSTKCLKESEETFTYDVTANGSNNFYGSVKYKGKIVCTFDSHGEDYAQIKWTKESNTINDSDFFNEDIESTICDKLSEQSDVGNRYRYNDDIITEIEL
jgi:hypothetical protein